MKWYQFAVRISFNNHQNLNVMIKETVQAITWVAISVVFFTFLGMGLQCIGHLFVWNRVIPIEEWRVLGWFLEIIWAIMWVMIGINSVADQFEIFE